MTKIDAQDGGSFDAYVASPAKSSAPGLVLMQYICGVNKVMRDIADDFASKGFLVACPDLFWRQEPNVQLNDDPANPSPEHFQRALELNDGFDDEAAIMDLASTLDFLRSHDSCSGKVGVVGYCLGGRTAYLMAARTNADCSVGYYGVNIQGYLDEADNINNPLMLHLAGNDEFCPPDIAATIVDRLAPLAQTTLFEYEGAGHAFALAGGPNYNESASNLANQRSLTFLKDQLF
jgi:carboxymethylenebutenolidase